MYRVQCTSRGVHRESTGRLDIQKKVQLGRRTMYSMMGAGVCGGSGLNPIVSSHLWKIYVVPRVLYGLEILSLTLADVTALERLQREMLRKLQSLTRSTATVAVTCLLGIRPLENELDLRRLTLLCNVLFTDGTLEQDVALRQIAVNMPIVIAGLLPVTVFCISITSQIYTSLRSSFLQKINVKLRSKCKWTAWCLILGVQRRQQNQHWST